jgi:hypothetical protein
MKRTITRNIFAVTLTTALAVGVASTAQAADKGCSNATLTGTFAYTNTGFFTAAAGPTPPSRPVRRRRRRDVRWERRHYGHYVGKHKRQHIPGDYKRHILRESGLHWHVDTCAFHSESPSDSSARSGLFCDRR